MTASPSTAGRSRTSIFGKPWGPLASKQHPQVRQEIQLDSPFREYAPGDSISGRVHLDVPRPVRATHLVVRLQGFVKVITHSKLPGEAIPYDETLLNSAKGRRGREYFGNGFAKLFEDEHVLCGDGRLYGKYVFQFEVILPGQNIPSSIDFENGTITYLLVSTLTRPTTMSPTLVEHCKLKVKENIDIARVPKPRPQSVSLETIKNRKPAMQMKRKISGSLISQDQTVPKEEGLATLPTSPSSVEAPGSPGPSEMSSTSVNSSSTSNTRSGTNPLTCHDSRSATSAMFSVTSSDRTITAQTEVLQGGCLPGDVLPIRVSVDHTKPIKSMQGVIVTFYRLARIDVHPALPLGPSDDPNARYEDYYPKSRTGLGGLSLSSAGSSRTFRQDLAQNIAPLIIDPTSLTAVLKTSVQVPDHVFPSIRGVPGSMISFKYFVEIVIDLRGKLGQDRILPRFSMTNTPQHAYEDPKINAIDGKDGVTFSTTPGFNFLITDQIRRQKGIVCTKTEVLLGTKDSARSQAKQKEIDLSSTYIRGDLPLRRLDDSMHNNGQNGIHCQDQLTSPQSWRRGQNGVRGRQRIAPPSPLEEPVDEKARIRRAEQTLLPSAPPEADSLMGDRGPTPSAPPALDEEDFIQRYNLQAPAPKYERYEASSVDPETLRATDPLDLTAGRTHPVNSHLSTRRDVCDDDRRCELNGHRNIPDSETDRSSTVSGFVSGRLSEAGTSDHTGDDQATSATTAGPPLTSSNSQNPRQTHCSTENVKLNSTEPDMQEMESLRLEELAGFAGGGIPGQTALEIPSP